MHQFYLSRGPQGGIAIIDRHHDKYDWCIMDGYICPPIEPARWMLIRNSQFSDHLRASTHIVFEGSLVDCYAKVGLLGGYL